MKIGIITQPLELNYGGIIQNYALQYILKELGHEVITLDQPSSYPLSLKYYLIPDITESVKNVARWLLGKKNVTLPSIRARKEQLRKDDLSYFINKYISRTEKVYKNDDLKKIVLEEKIDVLIVGSDQVWRPKYNLDIYNSFLSFAKDLPMIKLSYAASFGTGKWEYTKKQEIKCASLLKMFTGISVREMSGCQMCIEHFHINPQLVLDPTFLINKDVYKSIANSNNVSHSSGNLFCYFLDVNPIKLDIASTVSQKYNLNPFSVLSPEYPLSVKLDSVKRSPLEKWLRSFIDAKYVICDSYHGVVFSLIFNKNFMIVLNKDRGISRFDSLLSQFEISKDVIVNSANPLNLQFVKNDWEKINCLIEKMKIQSISFISSNIF